MAPLFESSSEIIELESLRYEYLQSATSTEMGARCWATRRKEGKRLEEKVVTSPTTEREKGE